MNQMFERSSNLPVDLYHVLPESSQVPHISGHNHTMMPTIAGGEVCKGWIFRLHGVVVLFLLPWDHDELPNHALLGENMRQYNAFL